MSRKTTRRGFMKTGALVGLGFCVGGCRAPAKSCGFPKDKLNNSPLNYVDATDLARRIRAKEVSPVEVMQEHLERIGSINSKINAIVVMNEAAMAQAQEAEAAIMRGERGGALHGVPFTAKEVFDTEGTRTTRGSLLFENRVPKADATSVRRLKEAGAILVGKTNCPEFALSAETVNDLFGRTTNPWNTARTSGGSSGGEAAAISAGLSPLGIGTDLGGSNRLPSHYCNTVGFKPTYGRIPLTGSWPEIMSRRMHVGPIARSVRDVGLALSVLSGPDGIDPYALNLPAPQLTGLDGSGPVLRVGFFTEEPFAPVDAEIQDVVTRAAAVLESLACTVEPVAFDWQDRLPIAFTLEMLVVEARHYFAPVVSGHEDRLSDSIKALLGAPRPTRSDYMKAMDKHQALARDLARFFGEYDLLLCPTAPNVAPAHDSAKLVIDGVSAEASHAANITCTFGMSGHPAISIPFGMSTDGLPIGVQLVAKHLDEEALLRAAAMLEAASAMSELRPPG